MQRIHLENLCTAKRN